MFETNRDYIIATSMSTLTSSWWRRVRMEVTPTASERRVIFNTSLLLTLQGSWWQKRRAAHAEGTSYNHVAPHICTNTNIIYIIYIFVDDVSAYYEALKVMRSVSLAGPFARFTSINCPSKSTTYIAASVTYASQIYN